MLSLLRELILVDRSGSQVLRLTQGAAYHTSQTMNQNIVEGPQDFPWHSQRKSNVGARWQLLIEFKKNSAGGDVSGESAHFSMVSR